MRILMASLETWTHVLLTVALAFETELKRDMQRRRYGVMGWTLFHLNKALSEQKGPVIGVLAHQAVIPVVALSALPLVNRPRKRSTLGMVLRHPMPG